DEEEPYSFERRKESDRGGTRRRQRKSVRGAGRRSRTRKRTPARSRGKLERGGWSLRGREPIGQSGPRIVGNPSKTGAAGRCDRADGERRIEMSTKSAAEAEETTAEAPAETPGEDPMLDSLAAAVKKIVAKAKQRGYINEAEMNEALPGDQFTSDQIEDALARLAELGVNIVDTDEQEEAEQAKQADAAESDSSDDDEVEERKAGN